MYKRQGEESTGCKITAEVSPDYGPYEIAKDAPAIKAAARAAEKLGFPVELEESGGGSDEMCIRDSPAGGAGGGR